MASEQCGSGVGSPAAHGANDYLNTVIPYTNPLYRDNRPNVGVPEDKVLPINETLGLPPQYGTSQKTLGRGQGRHHPWHWLREFAPLAFPVDGHLAYLRAGPVGTEGWAGRVIRDLDPGGENVLKGVNFGQGLPRALVVRGVPVTSVSDLESYGVLTGGAGHQREQEKTKVLERFARMYAPAIGTGPVMDYLGHTGQDVLKGVDILKTAPQNTPRRCSMPIPRWRKSAQYRPGLPGRSGHAGVLHGAWQLRYPLQPGPVITSCGSTSPRPSRAFSPTCGSTTPAKT